MKKILLVLILLSNMSFSKIFNFLQTDFKAQVLEKSYINNKNKEKEYDLSYTKEKLELKILKPSINKGEIYTFTKNKKFLYSPLLKQKVEQSLSNHDESLYSILSDMAKLEKKENHVIKDKKYVFKEGKLVNIIAKDYKITLKEYIGEKPTKILFLSNSLKMEYTINYK